MEKRMEDGEEDGRWRRGWKMKESMRSEKLLESQLCFTRFNPTWAEDVPMSNVNSWYLAADWIENQLGLHSFNCIILTEEATNLKEPDFLATPS